MKPPFFDTVCTVLLSRMPHKTRKKHMYKLVQKKKTLPHELPLLPDNLGRPCPANLPKRKNSTLNTLNSALFLLLKPVDTTKPREMSQLLLILPPLPVGYPAQEYSKQKSRTKFKCGVPSDFSIPVEVSPLTGEWWAELNSLPIS